MLSNNVNQQFNLLHEIGKEGTYHLLFPPPQAGLAILSLYQKVRSGAFPNGRFKEPDIYTALEGSKLLMNAYEYERSPQMHFNTIVSDLQVYFLRYDTEEQIYSLKDYAESFCRQVEETLLANFNPTQIETICNDLRNKLEACADQYDIQNWIDTFFSIFKPVMKSQVDRLERQIDNSVQEIRATTQLSDLSILDILKAIDQKLDRLRTQNEELRSAFREMKTINLVLEGKLQSVSEQKIADNIAEVRGFFPDVKYTLNIIDKRLDRIQPKLRQFFGMLNKPSFNIKVEKFLKFLLNKSTLSAQKDVLLPKGIPTLLFHHQTSNFSIFERREDIFPTKPKPRIKPDENLEEKEKGLRVAKNQLVMYNKIDAWMDEIIQAAATEEVLFSSYYFKILEVESGTLELAINVAYTLIRRAERDRKLVLNISTTKIKHPQHQSALWEMKINYQQ
jgi:hypothetical protein